jgi:WD40 repeat protein
VLSTVGTGGMGVVYKARHRDLQRVVALKTLRAGVYADPEACERLRTEAEAVARLQHPNIIQVFEIGTVEARAGEPFPSPFLALEYVDGGSLARHTKVPLPPARAAELVEIVARAVHVAHQAGVIHRDLKPANVLLTAAGEPKIADFGLAKRLGAERDSGGRFVTQAGRVVGTPEYMAPEQLSSDPPTPSVDVYALGVMLYELLTGRVPFCGATPEDTLYLVWTADPVPPRRLQPSLPRDLDTICLKALQKSPAARYATSEQLAEDLARWRGGRPILTRRVGLAGRAGRWARRNPAVAALSLLVVLVGLAGFGGVVWKWQEAQIHAAAADLAATQAHLHTRLERWERYRAAVAAASSELRLHNVVAARRALQAAPEEHRNWEWHYFWSRLDDSAHTLNLGGGTPYLLNFGPALNRVAYTTTDSALLVWDVRERKPVRRINLAEPMDRFAISPNGQIIAQVWADHTVTVRDIDSDRVLGVLRGHERQIVAVQFSLDSTQIITASDDRSIRTWEAATGRPIRTLLDHPAATMRLEFSQDGTRLVSNGGGDRTVRVWDARTGAALALLRGHTGDLKHACFNPDGGRVITLEGFPTNTLRLWDVATAKVVAVLAGHTNEVTLVEFSPDGRRLVTTSYDQTARLWNADGALVAVLTGHRGRVCHAAFSSDSTRLVTAAADKSLQLWDAATGASLAVLHGHDDLVARAAFTPDAAEIVSASYDGTIRTWDARRAESGRTLRGHQKYVYAGVFHPDGRRVASAAWDGTARLWDSTTGRQLRTFTHGETAIVASVAIHPDGRLLATLGRDNVARLWDLDTGEALHAWKVPVNSWQDPRLAFSPDGRLLAVGANDGTVRLMDVVSRAEVAVLRGHRTGVRDVAFSPDGHFVASTGEYGDCTARIWDVAARTEVARLEGHRACVYSVAFSHDGSLLATGSQDGTVRLWDARSRLLLAVLNQGTSAFGLAFSPDGTRLAVACEDNAIRLWDVAARQEVAEVWGHTAYVHAVAFSPDGGRLLSASGDSTLRLWDAGPQADAAQ